MGTDFPEPLSLHSVGWTSNLEQYGGHDSPQGMAVSARVDLDSSCEFRPSPPTYLDFPFCCLLFPRTLKLLQSVRPPWKCTAGSFPFRARCMFPSPAIQRDGSGVADPIGRATILTHVKCYPQRDLPLILTARNFPLSHFPR